jgi:hypothetical protein
VDKTAIRNFAVKARRKLIEDITHKAYEIGITGIFLFVCPAEQHNVYE